MVLKNNTSPPTSSLPSRQCVEQLGRLHAAVPPAGRRVHVGEDGWPKVSSSFVKNFSHLSRKKVIQSIRYTAANIMTHMTLCYIGNVSTWGLHKSIQHIPSLTFLLLGKQAAPSGYQTLWVETPPRSLWNK